MITIVGKYALDEESSSLMISPTSQIQISLLLTQLQSRKSHLERNAFVFMLCLYAAVDRLPNLSNVTLSGCYGWV